MNNDQNNNLNGNVLGSENPNGVVNPTIPEGSQVITPTLAVNEPVNPAPEVMPVPPVAPTPPEVGNVVQPPVSEVMANPPVEPQVTQVPPIEGNVVTPQPVQEPAYTNPNTINPSPEVQANINPGVVAPNPMPGFEPSSSIGTTPPISLEQEKEPKQKTNKTLFIALIVVLIVIIGGATYFVLTKTDIAKKKVQVSISVKDIKIGMGEQLSNNINDYATITGTDSKNCSLNTQDVDVNTAGVYNYKITCGETVRTGKITVEGVADFTVSLKPVYKIKGSTLDASEFLSDSSSGIKMSFVDEASVLSQMNSGSGKYLVQLMASDSSGAVKQVVGTLILTESEIKGFVVCNSNQQTVQESSATMVVTDKFAILTDENKYGNVANEIYTFKYSDETEYKKVIDEYERTSNNTINGVTGSIEYDNSTLTITVSTDLDDSKVTSDFGAENMQNYRSIMTYFGTTRGYNCTYQKNQ